MDWFPYDRDTRHERVKKQEWESVSKSFDFEKFLCLDGFISCDSFLNSVNQITKIITLIIRQCYGQSYSNIIYS